MKRLIYQYWTGAMPTYAEVSKDLFEAYARKFGAEYIFEQDPQFFRGKYSRYYNALKPIFDINFHGYDQVLFVDMDVIPLQSNTSNIFEASSSHIAMVEEVDQPQLRSNMLGNINSKNDLRWARAVNLFWKVQVPVDGLGRPKVFNSGVVLYSKAGMEFARENFASVKMYQYLMTLSGLPRFYRLDQNYLGAFIGKDGCEFASLPAHWNSQVTSATTLEGESIVIDKRTEASKFIHMQHGSEKKQKMKYDDALSVSKGKYSF